jgi:hypothetical protein
MPNPFKIDLIDQGWLVPSEAGFDLCSHGHLRLTIGGVLIVDGSENYGISESALAMLRTLGANHNRGVPVADRMVFHGCGTMLMMGCPIGVDFSVEHGQRGVEIADVVRYDSTSESQATRFAGLSVRLPEAEYRDHVVGFALRARELFEGTTKLFGDEFDERQYRDFWAEFNGILAAHGQAA